MHRCQILLEDIKVHFSPIQTVSLILQPCTSLTEASMTDEIVFFPNPAQNSLIINCNTKRELIFHDKVGLKVYTFTLQPGINSIDIAQFEPGMYILISGKAKFKLAIYRD